MQGMRDLMRLSLARSLRTLAEEDRLAAALPVVCGSAMAAQCTVERLDDERRVCVRVRAEWMEAMEGMREVVWHDLQRVSGVELSGMTLLAEEAVRVPRKPPMRAVGSETWRVQRRVGR